MAKNISAFKTLEKDDQISLLKGSVVDIMMLRSAVNYDPHSETWSLSTKDCLAKPARGSAAASSSSSSSTSSSPPPVSATSPGFVMGSPPSFGAGSPVFSSGSPGVGIPAAYMGSPGPGKSAGVDRISADVLKSGSPETLQLFLNYSKFIKSLMSSIHGDLLVLKILIMMSLFSADRSTHVDRAKVQAVQESYATVLQVS